MKDVPFFNLWVKIGLVKWFILNDFLNINFQIMPIEFELQLANKMVKLLLEDSILPVAYDLDIWGHSVLIVQTVNEGKFRGVPPHILELLASVGRALKDNLTELPIQWVQSEVHRTTYCRPQMSTCLNLRVAGKKKGKIQCPITPAYWI